MWSERIVKLFKLYVSCAGFTKDYISLSVEFEDRITRVVSATLTLHCV